MPMVTIDFVDGVSFDPSEYFNEYRTLQMLSVGLCKLADTLKRRETAWEQQTGGKITTFIYGLDINGTKGDLDLIACIFHWFGVSVCNFARLVGFIRGLSAGDFVRDDLKNSTRYRHITMSVDTYLQSLPELSDVLVWRNKVGAHFAITYPYKTDNIATLDVSVMFPVTFSDGRYRVGELVLTRGGATGTSRSGLPCWSVTRVFESLIPRYWPNAPAVSPPESIGGAL